MLKCDYLEAGFALLVNKSPGAGRGHCGAEPPGQDRDAAAGAVVWLGRQVRSWASPLNRLISIALRPQQQAQKQTTQQNYDPRFLQYAQNVEQRLGMMEHANQERLQRELWTR